MILPESRLHSRVLEPLIGKPLEFNIKHPKTLGSTLFLLKAFEQRDSESKKLKANARCHFQLFTDGLLLKTTNSTVTQAIPVNYKDILKFKLIRGEETINPFLLSPMWFLLKLGVPIIKARYFRLRMTEYFINKMTLLIVTDKYSMAFEGGGYKFEAQTKFFKELPIEVDIEIN